MHDRKDIYRPYEEHGYRLSDHEEWRSSDQGIHGNRNGWKEKRLSWCLLDRKKRIHTDIIS